MLRFAVLFPVLFGVQIVLADPETSAEPQEPAVVNLAKPIPLGGSSLSLQEAVELALGRNPDLIVEKIRLESGRERIEEERGSYDPIFSLRGSVGRKDEVIASRFFPNGFFVEKEKSIGLNLKGKTHTGGQYGVDFGFQRLKSTSNTQTLSPEYAPILTFSLSHSLLRDFGLDINTTQIKVAEKGAEIDEQSLALKLANLIKDVEEAYWNLVFLRQDLTVKKKSLELARELLRQNEDLLRAGRVAPVSVQEARAGVAAREEAVIVADNEIKKAEDQLKLLLHVDLSSGSVVPVEELAYNDIDVTLDQSVEHALKQRPEIIAQQKDLEQKELQKKFAYNQTLPRLDLSASYGMVGLSGRRNKTPLDGGGPCDLDGTDTPLDPSDNCVGASVTGSAFENQTSPSDAFDGFFRQKGFDNWSVQSKLEIPLWNRTARAQYAEAKLGVMESKIRLRSLKEKVSSQVRDAIRNLLTARKRIDVTREAVRTVEEQLQGVRKKFDAGIITSYEVLQVVDDLARAKTNEFKAVMDYNVGQAELRVAEASILEKYHVEADKPPRFLFQEKP